ncbi:MAG: lysozyme [Thermoleophilaceae bacterium]|nr:lysozyme [Thermoleophilaceae bacterium]
MFDTTNRPRHTFSGLPVQAVAAYANGRFANVAAAQADFPQARLLQIDVRGDGIGNCGDFEPRDMSYAHAGRWAKGRMNVGVWRPVLYFSVSNWKTVMQALQGAGVARDSVRLWTAHYNGQPHLCSSACGFGVTGLADATQWGSSDAAGTLPHVYAGRNIDESQTAPDFWGETPHPPPFKATLTVGATGHDVKLWQIQMATRGWHIATSGTYDAASEAICKAFQNEKALTITGDVNESTWNATWSAPITP